AACPAGSVLTAGGFYTNSDGSARVFLNALRSLGWQTSVRKLTGGTPILSVNTIFLSGLPSIASTAVGQAQTAAGEKCFTQASCPPGSVLKGLGFASGPEDMWVYRKAYVDARAHRVNLSSMNQTIRTYALCLTVAGTTTVQATNSTTVATHSTAALEISCPPGTVPTGAGFALAQPLNMVGLLKKTGPNMILAKASNLSGSNLALTAYASYLAIS
ncbi:MAG: hypothetical protein JW929_06380, partial [Anaerolineales bacterium]|nr:hypothetical protein [Anaerolineales bacterium]